MLVFFSSSFSNGSTSTRKVTHTFDFLRIKIFKTKKCRRWIDQLVLGQFSMQGFWGEERGFVVVAVCLFHFFTYVENVWCCGWQIISDIKKVIYDAHILHEHPTSELKGCRKEGGREWARQALGRVAVRRDWVFGKATACAIAPTSTPRAFFIRLSSCLEFFHWIKNKNRNPNIMILVSMLVSKSLHSCCQPEASCAGWAVLTACGDRALPALRAGQRPKDA